MTRGELLETAAVAGMLTGLGAYLFAIAYLLLMP
jgi:hypothetical protein